MQGETELTRLQNEHQKKSGNWYFEIFRVFQCSVPCEVKKSNLCEVRFHPRKVRFNQPPL